ncbi:glycosyltransferase [Aquicoccus sp. SCR17]|nr:glycosyltransferase [Carideicomes alvinocaridis]
MKDIATAVDPAAILVALPTLNEEAHVGATLEALMGDDPEMRKVRIVVADGGSTDRTRAIVAEHAARHDNIRLVDNRARLQAAAVNLVAERCADPQHAVLVRVDAHAVYPPDYVRSVADSLLRHEADGLATVMDSVGASGFQRGAARAVGCWLGTGGSRHRGGTRSGWVDHGHHAGFLLEAWRGVGGYDAGFVANEDAELDHRLGRAGRRIWLDATIRIGYVMRDTPGRLARQYWRYGIGRAQTILTHRMRPRLRQVIPPLCAAANLAGLLAAPLWPGMLALPALYLLLVAGVTAQLVARHREACTLWAGPALIVMHHGWGLGFIARLCGLAGGGR